MGTHPNAILLLTLTPDDLARKTYRAILADAGVKDEGEDTDAIKINGEDYHHEVMEDDYADGYQISAPEGSIILFGMVTYGYGEKITWDKLEKQKMELEAWAKDICARFHCAYTIEITANYW